MENEDFFHLFHHQVHNPVLMGCAHGGEPNAKENAPLWAPSYHTSDGRLQNKNHPWKLETKARVVSNQVLLEGSTIEKCYGGRARERVNAFTYSNGLQQSQ